MDIILTLTLILIFSIVTMLLYLYFTRKNPGKNPSTRVTEKPLLEFTTCLLCGSHLQKGERMKTDVYRGNNYSVVHITGCPWCNGKSSNRTRKCPQCKRELPMDKYLVGKMWKKDNGKIHVQVSGCAFCTYGKHR
ncbi:MAG: hypothetical protein ACOCX9_08245 [Spirochaetota bacterium]